MAHFDEASPICRGKNLSWETVLLFYNNMPKESMPKADFNAYTEARINAWTQTHSQIARQLAFYYEENGMCYPRFTNRTNLKDLFVYMQNWAAKYFIPNPFAPSLKGYTPTCIYAKILDAINSGNKDFDNILDTIFDVQLSSHDKVNVYLSNFTNLLIDNNKQVSINERVPGIETILHPDEKYASDPKLYYEYFNTPYIENASSKKNNNLLQPLQQIYYGAPGTGKSDEVDDMCSKYIHHRITFHPDTDYSAFVGCYKPKTHKKNLLAGNGINETQLLSSFFDSNSPKYKSKNKARYLYEALIHTKDIRDLGLDAQSVSDKLNKQGFEGCAYTTEATCMYNIYDWLKEDGYIVENKIAYEFIPQCFIKAYVDAWKNQKEGKPVFLVIEEINRGNCAQIFGDLFQLLDRDKNGFSRYEISPDTDLQEYLAEQGLNLSGITDHEGNDISAQIANGELMKLPNNLYIWATMNTSDQSLFPIDSAFKRRWDWKYIKIKKGVDKQTKQPLDWKIKVGEGYDWWEFINKINDRIVAMTSTADKQLGYFFCLANDNGEIAADTFVNKVAFYLWNDVFKDYAEDGSPLLKYKKKEDDKEESDLTFPDFFDEQGEIDENVVKQFIDHVIKDEKTENKAE